MPVPDGLLTIGRITGIHGLKGYLKVRSFAASHTVFQTEMRVLCRKAGVEQRLVIETATPHKKGMLIRFRDVNPDQAGALVDGDLIMSREDLPPLEEDAYYWQDLIGMTVTDVNRGVLGRVHSMMETGGKDVVVVRGGEREVLIPFVDQMVLSVDVEQKEMKVDLPEGL